MGSLEDLVTGRRITLGNEFVVGRSSACALVLDDRAVSGQHALLRWRRGRWAVRDLGSRNGTTIDQTELSPGRSQEISPGTVLGFGGAQQRWRLIDEGPPFIAAYHPQSGRILRAEDGFLGLPHLDSPEAMVYCDENGGWMLERTDELLPARDQDELSLSDGRWQLWVPQRGDMLESTPLMGDAPRVLRLMTLNFRVSRNEEYVELSFHDGTESTALGARSHHHMLLTLARARQRDHHDMNIGHAEEGWLYSDELCKMLDCDPDTLNIHVFRARKQLSQAGVDNGGEIIQRRPSTRQLRIGTNRLSIETL